MSNPETAKAKYTRKCTREAFASGIQGASARYSDGVHRFAGVTPGPRRMKNYNDGMAAAPDNYARGVAGKADYWFQRYCEEMAK